jgi:hypothetical protein
VGRAAGVGGWPRQRRRTGVSVLHEFWVDLALRYFVSFLYNLDGFMEPLRTGLSEGAFCVLGDFGGNARSLDFASGSLCESDAALGMTNFWSG